MIVEDKIKIEWGKNNFSGKGKAAVYINFQIVRSFLHGVFYGHPFVLKNFSWHFYRQSIISLLPNIYLCFMSVYNNQLQKKFEAAYNSLNTAQQTAVNQIDGPVMVIAGPGTGKTQILACRIGKILLETDTHPDNILCLTFTEAGVVAMRKRLLEFIGPDAYKVNIHTYHAFCNEVIQENLHDFQKTGMDPISDLERIQLLKDLIDKLPKNHPLKKYRGKIYHEIKNLQGLFSTMKRESWTPEFLLDKINIYTSGLKDDENFIYKKSKAGVFNKGDLKASYYEEVDRMEKLKAAVNEFENYQELMQQMNRYDFDDMINWVNKAFATNANLLAKYQERFQYLLVDEYQDTSGSQNNLVQLLINYWEHPNVFVVGDDDQSIFRFQGANVENMLHFANQYQDEILKVVLTNNYRSTQPILDAAKALIENNTERLVHQMPGLSKDLIASNDTINQLKQLPEIHEYDTQHHEMIGVVMKTKALLDEGVNPDNIGIIYRENIYGDTIQKYFSLLRIPVFSKRNENALNLPLTRKIILVLQYLSSEHYIPYSGDEMLFEMLHFNWFGITPHEIAKMTSEVAEKRYTPEKTSLREWLNNKIAPQPGMLFDRNVSDEMRSALLTIEKLIAAVPNNTLQSLFEKVIREAGVIKHIMQSPDKHWQLQILSSLFDFIKEETHRKPGLSLKELVSLIELMEQEKIGIPILQVMGNEKGVNIMTAHGSKGLEFEYVFFVGNNASVWEKKTANNKGYKIPPTVFTVASNTKDWQEMRRLFYVAMTRAEKHLHISYSRMNKNGKLAEPAVFIAEITSAYQLPVNKITLDQDTINDFIALDFTEEKAPEISQAEASLIDPILDKFVMNVTALNSYLNCPLQFYYTNLVRIPSAKNEAATFGSAVHFALEQLFKKMLDDATKNFPSKENFIGLFEWFMNRNRESFTKEQFSRRMEYGAEILSNYYDTNIHQFNKIVLNEITIKGVNIDHVPIKGKLDKLEFDGKRVNVVDYKSGNPENADKKLKAPSDKDPNGGDYWRQAVFYKLLVENKPGKDWAVNTVEFDFVEPDNKKKYHKKKVVIATEDVERVKEQIKTTWEKIQNRDFYTGCGKIDCHWCNFVKTNDLAIAYHDADAEEEF